MGKREIHLRERMTEGVVEAGCDEAGRGPLAGPVFAAAVVLPEGFRHPLLNDSKKMNERARNELREIIEREAVAWAVEAAGAAEIDRINILNASIAAMQRAVMRLRPVPQHLIVDGNRWRSFSRIREICASCPDPELFGSDGSPLRVPYLFPGSSPDPNPFGPDGSPLRSPNLSPADFPASSPDSADGGRPGSRSNSADGKMEAEGSPSIGDLENSAREYDMIPVDCIVKGDATFAAIAAASVLAKTHRDEYMRKIAADYPQYGWDRNMGYPTPEHVAAIRAHGLTPHHRLSFRVPTAE